MKLHVTKDTTSKILHVFIQDSSATDGSGLLGVTFGYAGLSAYYVRPGDVTSTQITLADIDSLGTWVSGGFKEFDQSNMPGLYEIHIPDGALATGVDQVVLMYHGAADMAPVLLEVQLTDFDLNTALPSNFSSTQISSVGYVSSNQLQVTGQNIELATTVDANIVQVDGSDVELGTTIDANVTQISGDITAADNAELFFDDTGFNASSSTIGTVTEVTNEVSGGTSAAEVWGYAGTRDLNAAVDLQTATQASIDAVETDTNEIQGKLPTGDIADESNVEGHVTTSLTSYDPPTRTEATADKDEIIAGQSSGGTTPSEIWGYASRGLTDEVSADVVKISGDSTSAESLEALLKSYETGTAQAGGSNTITLAAGASAVDNFYANFFVSIHTGTGFGQIGRVLSYVGGTKIATMADDWIVEPDVTSEYLLIPDEGAILTGTPDVNATTMSDTAASTIWGYASRGLTDVVDLQTATQASIDAIETDTNEIQGKLPTGDIADESNVEGHVTTSLSSYDPPTRTEATADKDEIIAGQSSGGTTPSEIWGYAGRELTGVTDSNLTQILGTSVTEDVAGQVSAAFKMFFDVTTPAKDINDVGTATISGGVDVTSISGNTISGYAGSNFNDFFDVFPMETTDVNDVRDIKVVMQSRGR